MKFKSFVLDPFQEEAIHSVEKGNSVVVSAATGTGKTLIADYIIDKYLHLNKRIIYTAPIKALSNQKYRDFKKDYGEDKIGLMTGDIVVNPDAPILVMTAEIYRNMLLSKDELVDFVKYVIFDEIHYINDIERGTIWEESIIFSPSHVRFLCLSATIPNSREFADWIQSIKKHTVDVVKYDKRAVPLEHYVFDSVLGVTRIENVSSEPRKKRKKGEKQKESPSHIDLISSIMDKLPCIFFFFSRADCEKKAEELARKRDFADKNKRKLIVEMANRLISPEYRSLESIQRLKKALNKGIAFHHAGMLPRAKELVEELFSRGMIKVLYATETFAVGINMPAKTVCFGSLEKYDGANFRYINSKEYFQMAGRAGRRGIDKIGYVVAIIDRAYTDLEKVRQMSLRDDIPIQSQFKLCVNTVLNLIKNHTPEEREVLLRMNFDYFLKKQSSKTQVRIMATYNNKLKILKMMGYIFGDKLTEKGEFATKIYANEIIVSEIFCSDIFRDLEDAEINILIAAIIYEPRGKDYFSMKGIERQYSRIMKAISRSQYVMKNLNKLYVKRMVKVVGKFTEGSEFRELLEFCNLDEGDLIRLFRRIIDLIRQIRHATHNYELGEILARCQEKLYRDVVRFEF